MNEDLSTEIQRLKKKREKVQKTVGVRGYSLSTIMLADLIVCVVIGLGLGFFFQKVFHTSPLLTAGMTFLGGIAGLYTVVRFAIYEDKGIKK